jgi:acyl-CoA dehydrogenase
MLLAFECCRRRIKSRPSRASFARDERLLNGPSAIGEDELVMAEKNLRARAQLAADVAASHATTVDVETRFPEEAFAVARAQRLLGIMVPNELGGEGASFQDVADVCYVLGRGCASTAMIYAMHQTKMACVIRHRRGNPWQERTLRRICDEQLLLASSTTEGQGGGNIRYSVAPVGVQGSHISLERNASCISYGAHADGIVTTARRSAEASGSDQVLVVFLKQDYSLDPTVSWDTLGMRGTCSVGFMLKAGGKSDQILSDPYEKIHSRTMMPVAHIFWGGVWTGVAAGAVARARSFVRNAARRGNGQLPPGAPHLTRAMSTLRTLRGVLTSAIQKYEAVSSDDDALDSVEIQTLMTMLKVNASELAVSTVLSCMQACGLSGYRNDTEFSIGRHLRDILSSPIMINNDRILSDLTGASIFSAVPTSLAD